MVLGKEARSQIVAMRVWTARAAVRPLVSFSQDTAGARWEPFGGRLFRSVVQDGNQRARWALAWMVGSAGSGAWM